MPEGDVLEPGLGVAAQDARQPADALGGDRVSLVRHRRRAFLGAGGERLLDLAHLRPLEVADLLAEALDPGAGERDRLQDVGMAVARDDLGGDLLGPQPEPVHDCSLDARRGRGVGADGAGELADRSLREGFAQAGQVAVRLEREAGEAEPEAGRLGVDAVGTPDAERLGVLSRLRNERVAIAARARGQDRPGLDQLQRQRRIEHVGGGEPVVDPPSVLADRVGDHVDERGDVVIGRPLPLLDGRDRERRPLAASRRRRRRDPSLGRPGVGRSELDLEPAVHTPLVAPDGADLLSRVAGDQLGGSIVTR